MEAMSRDGKDKYSTPRWVQVWFLRRSRDNWKRKYKQLKTDAKRLQNRVNDVTRSRERWREQAEEQRRRVQELDASNAAPAATAAPPGQAALKKDGRRDVAGRG